MMLTSRRYYGFDKCLTDKNQHKTYYLFLAFLISKEEGFYLNGESIYWVHRFFD